ncbi:MAG: hypothetical protein HZB51_23245 [Chloroflexi bacterium]|nr:hypothetical protein [Chloroflexota bacterium]
MIAQIFRKSLQLAIILMILGLTVIVNTNSAKAMTDGVTRYVATSGADTGNCLSSAVPCRTIQYAVNQSTSGDTILVAQGTYNYRASVDPCNFLQTRAVVCYVDKILKILGGYTTSNWSVANPSVNLTVIDGQNAYRGVAVIGYNTTTANLDLEGFTIQKGYALGPTYLSPYDPSGIGGGMWVQKATVTLRDLIFKDNQVFGANTSSGAGGAGVGAALRIESSPQGTSSLIQRVTFTNNKSYGGTGVDRGGLAFGALFIYSAAVDIRDSAFTNNQAIAGNGSGSGLGSDGLNSDALGGGIGIEFYSVITMQNVTITGNSIAGGNATSIGGGAWGAGLYSEGATSIAMTDCYVSGNVGTGGRGTTGGTAGGGGLLIADSSTNLVRMRVIANTATGGNSTNSSVAGGAIGGGIYFWSQIFGMPLATVVNTLVADNLATAGSIGYTMSGGGGGVAVQGLQATFNQTTIARNRLGPTLVSGQGLLVLGSNVVPTSSATVNYSIIAEHTTGGGGASAVLVQQNNSITFNKGLFAGNTKDTNVSGSPSLPGTFNGLNTMLSASSAGFVSPGVPNYNYRLLATSPAVDKATGSTVSTDVYGASRPYNLIPDLGASEYWPATVYSLHLPLVLR